MGWLLLVAFSNSAVETSQSELSDVDGYASRRGK
jgi:hypothetical protein